MAQGLRKAAVNASRASIEMTTAQDRKRGKGGKQTVRVEYAHIHAGGQAIVGDVPTSRGEVCKKVRENPMHRLPHWSTTLPLAQAPPRCGAKTRTGCPCRSPAIVNGRCRMYGGKSTGPRTAEDLKRIRNARTIHARYSAEMAYVRRLIAELRDLDRKARQTKL